MGESVPSPDLTLPFRYVYIYIYTQTVTVAMLTTVWCHLCASVIKERNFKSASIAVLERRERRDVISYFRTKN